MFICVWQSNVCVTFKFQEHKGLRSSLTLEFYRKTYDHIVEQYPYWNRSSGRDHIWVCYRTHDYQRWKEPRTELSLSPSLSQPPPPSLSLSLLHVCKSFCWYDICVVQPNELCLYLKGSRFHGMKVLAMPQRRYGTAWCWFTGVIQIQSITIQQQLTGPTTGISFLLTEEATIHVLTQIKILFFLHGNGLMSTPLPQNFGLGTFSSKVSFRYLPQVFASMFLLELQQNKSSITKNLSLIFPHKLHQ